MNGSTATATVLVDELVRGGVREAVLAPGSRSAPLAYALHAADRAGRLRLHVRVDERTAGFLALGLATVSEVPVPVVTTSGTAAVNLHPAVSEAHHSGVPLVAITADRPTELQGTGANQTTDQVGLYGDAARLATAVPAAAGVAGEVASWRALVCRALAAAAGELDGDPGPVHLDVAFREPLVPDGDPGWAEPLAGRPGGEPWTVVSLAPPVAASPLDGPAALGSSLARTLVLVGDAPPELVAAAHDLAARRGWTLVAEPTGWGPSAVPHGALLLGEGDFLARHLPQRVLVVGRPTLTRAVQRLLADPAVWVEVVTASPRWADPGRVARTVHHRGWLAAALREAPSGTAHAGPGPAASDRGWAATWEGAGAAVGHGLVPVLDGSWPSGPAVAAEVAAALPPGGLLVVGSSNAARDLDLAAAPRADVRVVANRGLAGIDGTVSTAVGAALAHAAQGGGPAYALLGDLTFLHDSTGLLLGPDEPRPDLTVVVVNDDGGGIFAGLEPGAPERASTFERLFGTPTGADLAALCAACGTPFVRVTAREELRSALRPAPGMRVVEVRVRRDDRRTLAAQLAAATASALRPG